MGSHARVFEAEVSGILSKDNRHRLERVMRLRDGDKFILTDGGGKEAVAVLCKAGAYKIIEWAEPKTELPVEITLFAAVSKGERFDWLVEKAVELGVRRIIPVISRFCVVKYPSEAKIERWQKIAVSAMLQCGGCVLPEIEKPVLLAEIPSVPKDVRAIALYEAEAEKCFSLKDLANNMHIWLFSGPEGGIASEEIDLLRRNGWQSIRLGKRILRAETAPMAAVSAIAANFWGKEFE
ncbi:MAG: 16S rRNA (uracil(1498)-N(3))-methyltransferase [Candidatus Rifleibacteriota bacterium]